MIFHIKNIPNNLLITCQTIIEFDEGFFTFFVDDKIKKVYLNGDFFMFSVDNKNVNLDPLILLNGEKITFKGFNSFVRKMLFHQVFLNSSELNFLQLKLLKKFIGAYYLTRDRVFTFDVYFLIEFEMCLDWNFISKNYKLSENIIEKFQDKLNWDYIFEYQTLSEPFIEKFRDKFDWEYISKKQKLSEFFIENFQNKIDWNGISTYQTLSEDFIDKFGGNFNRRYISSY